MSCFPSLSVTSRAQALKWQVNSSFSARYYKIGLVIEFASSLCEDKQHKLYFFYIFKVFSLILQSYWIKSLKKNQTVSFFKWKVLSCPPGVQIMVSRLEQLCQTMVWCSCWRTWDWLCTWKRPRVLRQTTSMSTTLTDGRKVNFNVTLILMFIYIIWLKALCSLNQSFINTCLY